jgi:hypothetical protein
VLMCLFAIHCLNTFSAYLHKRQTALSFVTIFDTRTPNIYDFIGLNFYRDNYMHTCQHISCKDLVFGGQGYLSGGKKV